MLTDRSPCSHCNNHGLRGQLPLGRGKESSELGACNLPRNHGLFQGVKPFELSLCLGLVVLVFAPECHTDLSCQTAEVGVADPVMCDFPGFLGGSIPKRG